ncbi:MAG: hypothetical protein WCE54_15085, partial [Ignavibacteriaceae bacterium]
MRRVLFAVILLLLFISNKVHPQILIKEKVSIHPDILSSGIIFNGCSYGYYDSTKLAISFTSYTIAPGKTSIMKLWNISSSGYIYEYNEDEDIIQ